MSFKVPKKKSITELEEDVLKFWKKNKVFEKSVEQRDNENGYIFYDGPPFISGLPHYGHLLGSIAKDIVPRYWTMKGKRVERVWGWDAHGLTVENKVQKKLGIKDRRDIEKFGLEEFTKECYVYTSETSAEWEWYIDKIGRWVDFKNAYKTIDQDYMESVIWAFKKLYEKGVIYEGVRTSLFCTTCGTPVSNFEIAMDNSYKDVEDPSIFVKFPVCSDGEFKEVNILAWTTTPWTVPSNRALVVDPDETYVLVFCDKEKYIVAKKRAEFVFEKKSYTIEKEFPGKSLLGLSYTPLYSFFAHNDKEFKVYAYEGMVEMTEGTGIVHSSPGFGEIDTEMGRQHGLTVMLTVDGEGKFVAGDVGKNPFEGMYYSDANDFIRKDLNDRNLLFRDERIVHRFPYHDRCDTLLIQKAQNSWFIDIASFKKELYEKNEDINWVPSYLKHGRFLKGIEQAPDWCISRNRYWATPMPLWESEDGDRIVIGSIAELEELSGQKVTDLHRPYIDKIVIEKDGKKYTRREEVLDSWFEAGSMPYAQVHYPFENKKKFESTFPGDYIVEYTGQVRAWFYVMHVLSTALFDSNSFRNVVVTGVMSGNDGRKMSKTYGNYTDPKEILEEVGGDALRLYLMNSPLMVGENTNFDDTELKTKSRNILNPLLNSARFFLIYAEKNDWRPIDYTPSAHILDRWIVTRINEVIKGFSENIENYQVPAAVKYVEDFVDDLSRWYVRRSRERISAADEEALSTLYYVLSRFCKCAAPVIPFLCETLYQDLVVAIDSKAPVSVHLCDYPEYDKDLIDKNQSLLQNMEIVRRLASLGNSARIEKQLPVRQPLTRMLVSGVSGLPPDLVEILCEELNIKSLEFVKEISEGKDFVTQTYKDLSISLDTQLTDTLVLEGSAREMIRKIQDLRKKEGMSVSDKIDVVYKDEENAREVVKVYEEEIREKVSALDIKPGKEYAIFKKT